MCLHEPKVLNLNAADVIRRPLGGGVHRGQVVLRGILHDVEPQHVVILGPGLILVVHPRCLVRFVRLYNSGSLHDTHIWGVGERGGRTAEVYIRDKNTIQRVLLHLVVVSV